MPLNFNLLRSFWAVASAGSVSGAAREGFISQPALSKAINELERQTGLPLLERGARGVTLTQAGQTLYEHAQAIFALEQGAEEALRAQRGLDGVTLRIGASSTIATYLLPPLLARFQVAHPGVALRVSSGNTRYIGEGLLAYAYDVALVEGPVHDEKIIAYHWREDELILVDAPPHGKHESAHSGTTVTWNYLRQRRWVVRESGSGTREVVEEALRSFGLPPEGALEVESGEAVKQAVAAGLGISMVSRAVASDQIALGKLQILEVTGFRLERPLWRLRLRGRPLSPVALAFEALLREEGAVSGEHKS